MIVMLIAKRAIKSQLLLLIVIIAIIALLDTNRIQWMQVIGNKN